MIFFLGAGSFSTTSICNLFARKMLLLQGIIQLRSRSFPWLCSVGCPSKVSLRAQSTEANQNSEDEESDEFRDHVHQFAQSVVAPLAAEVDRNNSFPSSINLWTAMGEFGLHGRNQQSLLLGLFKSPGGRIHVQGTF